MNTPITIPTEQENITLRQLTIADAPAYFEAVDANRTHLSQFDDPTAGNYPDLSSVEDSIRTPKNPDKLRLGIWDGDTFVGSINMTPDEQGAEIGYWMDARYTGHGYATIATRALSQYAAARYHVVHAEVVEGNDKSANVLLRAGFTPKTAKEVGRLSFELIRKSETCPADICGTIAQIETIITRDQRYNHPGLPTQLAVDLIKQGRITTFAEFEPWLREMGSRVHFIATPLDFFGDAYKNSTIYPYRPNETPEFTLWVGMNGPNEAKRMLAHLGVTEQENLKRLARTGVLTADSLQ